MRDRNRYDGVDPYVLLIGFALALAVLCFAVACDPPMPESVRLAGLPDAPTTAPAVNHYVGCRGTVLQREACYAANAARAHAAQAAQKGHTPTPYPQGTPCTP